MSFLDICYNISPVMLFLTFNSFISVLSKNVRQTLNFFLKKNLLLILRLSLYFQGLLLYDKFKLVSYTSMHRHVTYNDVCFTLFGVDDCCIESFRQLSEKYEKKLFFLENRKFIHYYFFIDFVNYMKILDNDFFILSNRFFNNILSLQFVEYYSIALEHTLLNDVGNVRAKKYRNRIYYTEYFFLDFWDLGYLYFHDVEVIFRFISMDLDYLQFLIIDYLIWSLDFNFGFKYNKDLTLYYNLFREGMCDFLYSSRLGSYLEFFCANNSVYFIDNFFNFKFYFIFLSIRDFLFGIIRSSVFLSICYYFLLVLLGLGLHYNSYRLMVLNLPLFFLKKKKEYVFLDYYL